MSRAPALSKRYFLHPGETDPELGARLREAARILGNVVAALGGIVLLGWLMGWQFLQQPIPGLAAMKAMTALGLLLSGVALSIGAREIGSYAADRVMMLSVVTVLLLTFITLVEYVAGMDLGVDELLVSDPDAPDPLYPGRMSPATAVCFLLAGGALLAVRRPRASRLVQILGVAGLLMTLASASAYLYGLPSLYGTVRYYATAPHTVVGMALLFTGIVLMRPLEGPIGLLCSHGEGGLAARRMLPIVIVAPIATGIAAIAFVRLGAVAVEVALSIFHTIITAILLVFVVLHARRVHDLSQERLATQEGRFRRAMELVPDPMLIVGTDGSIHFANQHAERLFGYPTGGLVDVPVETLVPLRHRQMHVIHRANYHANPHPRMMGEGSELTGLRRDGTEIPVEISLGPLSTDEGLLVLCAVRDITQRRRLAATLKEANEALERTVAERTAELRNAKERAEEADRNKTQFLATMSHELRTPLNAIIGFAGTLSMQLPGPLNTEQREQLEIIERSAHHLLSLINDLLDLAKIEAGRMRLERVPVACRPLIMELSGMLRPLAEKKGLALQTPATLDAHRVLADARALRQILLNLAYNAIKFTDGGTVSLEVIERPPSQIELAVTDTGIGIAASEQTNLFTAFSQIDQSHSEGTGLGLHLSAKLAQLMGTRICVESTPGRGSRFSLVLPRG